jgi:hypothetical protein
VERLPYSVYRLEANHTPEQITAYPGRQFVVGRTGGVDRNGGNVLGRASQRFGRNTKIVADSLRMIIGDNDRPEIHVLTIEGS